MKKINLEKVQEQLNYYIGEPAYLHLETTNGAYATHHNREAFNVGAFIRNTQITFNQAKISGDASNYRVGLKTEQGWVYAEGLREYHINEQAQLLLAGHDLQGRLLVTIELSKHPFDN
ncbi:Protein of unknown function [Amphibacillus marinus]|uniref:DUF1806 family protein n=1 Tax=Amphibacillus marinus TaxID=872970 RepID=A0A1H8RR77_9BACI|nr:DUF1806 family protein [Amphibacillus marinus]SEO68845.1 Protein of unknown function [Amphibacillus marinus]